MLVEFVKILATEELRVRAEDGLPIQVRLILRDQADRFLRKQIHFVDASIVVERKERIKRIKSEVFTSTKLEIAECNEKIMEKINEIENNQVKSQENKKEEAPRKMRKQLSFNNEFHKLKSSENLTITKIDKKLEISAKNSNKIKSSNKAKTPVFKQNFLDSDESDKTNNSEKPLTEESKRVNRRSVVSFQFSEEGRGKPARLSNSDSHVESDNRNGELIIEISAPPPAPSSPLTSSGNPSPNKSTTTTTKSPEGSLKNKKLDKLHDNEKKKRSSLNSASANSILFSFPASTGSRLRNSVKLPNFSSSKKEIKILHQDQPEPTYFDFYQSSTTLVRFSFPFLSLSPPLLFFYPSIRLFFSLSLFLLLFSSPSPSFPSPLPSIPFFEVVK